MNCNLLTGLENQPSYLKISIMNKIIISLSLLVALLTKSFAQISIDSLNVFSSTTTTVDSIFISGTSSGQELFNINIIPSNDACGTVHVGLIFKGCSPIQTTFFDTIISIGYPTNRFSIVAKWDTIYSCPYPTQPLYLDTLIWDNCGSLGVSKALLENKITVYPNPSKDILYIKPNENIIINRIELLDLQGKIIEAPLINTYQLSIGNISTGTYLLNFVTNEGIISKKITVE